MVPGLTLRSSMSRNCSIGSNTYDADRQVRANPVGQSHNIQDDSLAEL